MRLGVFGGAFNPPHLGHLACAQEAHARLGLEKVVWVPVGDAPHRDVPNDPGRAVRLQMCELAAGRDERFEVSPLEVERDGPSYTVDTLRALHESEPGGELVLILGADQAAALPSWKEPEEVMRLASVGVAARSGVGVREVEDALAGFQVRLEPFEMPRIDVSSTLVRERAATGLPIRYLVPDPVAELVAAQPLYGASVPA